MGYSCTQDAGNTLAVIGKMFATNGNPNVLTIRGKQYFFERGQEHTDGAITGKLMIMLPDDLCQFVGTVRIEPDGTIARFPALTRDHKEEAVNTMRDMSARNPQLLRQWAIGLTSFVSCETICLFAATVQQMDKLMPLSRCVPTL